MGLAERLKFGTKMGYVTCLLTPVTLLQELLSYYSIKSTTFDSPGPPGMSNASSITCCLNYFSSTGAGVEPSTINSMYTVYQQ